MFSFGVIDHCDRSLYTVPSTTLAYGDKAILVAAVAFFFPFSLKNIWLRTIEPREAEGSALLQTALSFAFDPSPLNRLRSHAR